MECNNRLAQIEQEVKIWGDWYNQGLITLEQCVRETTRLSVERSTIWKKMDAVEDVTMSLEQLLFEMTWADKTSLFLGKVYKDGKAVCL